MSTRRTFLKNSALASAAMAVPFSSLAGFTPEPPKFKMSINPGAIGVGMPMKPLMKLARQYGFKAMTPDVEAFKEMTPEDRKSFLNSFKVFGMSWDAAGLPIDFRNDATDFKMDLGTLVMNAISLQAMGATRMSTWIMPTHNKYNYRENFELHQERLTEIAMRLLSYDINLGLEYVGPKTLVERDKYPFIHNMEGLTELIKAIDMPNVGYQLDAFHWYCAGETVEDIRALKPDQIITVDLNDAKAGRTRDEQLDWERELPGKSGIIDIQGFLRALKEIGYDGPIRAEPFNKELGEMENHEAITETAHWMKRSFLLATD